MATLLQKKNGDFYIRGRAGGAFCTWQVTKAGVDYLLHEQGCVQGTTLHPDLVGYLVRNGYAYTHGSGTEQSPSGVGWHEPRHVSGDNGAVGRPAWLIILIIIILLGVLSLMFEQ
jgi:hypothetical protein